MWNTRCATSGKMFARLCIYRGLQSTATVRLYHFTNTNRVHTLLKCAGNKRVPIQVIGWCRQYSSRDQATSTNVNNDPELFHPTPTYDLPSNSSDVIQTVDNVASQSENVANATSAAIGGYTPSGILQSALDLLHTHTHMPWWVTIAAFTVVIRLMLVPMAVQLHINAIKIANVNPIAMEINKKMMEYKAAGNTIGMALEGKKLSELYVKHNCNPFKAFFMPLVQMPIFMSFFFALRQMTSLPLESMKTGGMLWFTDLTLADPTYVLPLMACASFITNIELGAEGGAPSDNDFSKKIKMVMRLSAVLILPISMKFPAALFMYWVTNSMFSTVQILVFRNPNVKKALGIPKLDRHQSTSTSP